MSVRDVPAQRWICDWPECEASPVLPTPEHPDGWLGLEYLQRQDFCSPEHLILWLNTRTLSRVGSRLSHLSDLLHIEVVR